MLEWIAPILLAVVWFSAGYGAGKWRTINRCRRDGMFAAAYDLEMKRLEGLKP